MVTCTYTPDDRPRDDASPPIWVVLRLLPRPRQAQDTLEGQRKSGKERTEEMYRRGKERVMRDLQREMVRICLYWYMYM